MASRLKVTGLKEFEREYLKILTTTFNRAYYLALGKQARQLLYARVKSGSGVSSDEDSAPVKTKLAALSPNYIKIRSRLQDAGRLGKFAKLGTSPRKSNLTNTGQMLESIEITDLPSGFRLTIPESSRDVGNTNAEVALRVSNAGRPFFALTDQEQLTLFRKIERDVRQAFRRLNKKR